jgi:hypothetical protein
VTSQKQQFEYARQAELDSQGNIFVSSDQGQLIWMGNDHHCSELSGATDRQTMGCSVMQDRAQGGAFDDSMSSLQLEIYRKGGHKQIVQPGAPILEWHFWKDGDQVAVYSGARRGNICSLRFCDGSSDCKTERASRRGFASSMGEEPGGA